MLLKSYGSDDEEEMGRGSFGLSSNTWSIVLTGGRSSTSSAASAASATVVATQHDAPGIISCQRADIKHRHQHQHQHQPQ